MAETAPSPDQGTAESATSTTGTTAPSRALMIAAVVLPLALLVGVAVTVRMAGEDKDAPAGPVSLGTLPSAEAPLAWSPECRSFTEALPGEIEGLRRADLAAPHPPSAAAYSGTLDGRAVEMQVRCGVRMPADYRPDAQATVFEGEAWFPVTAGGRTSFYSVDRKPFVLAVTAPESLGPAPIAALRGALAAVPPHDPALTGPVYVGTLTPGVAPGDDERCRAIVARAGGPLGDHHEAQARDTAGRAAPGAVRAWRGRGSSTIVLRCGLPRPAIIDVLAEEVVVTDVPGWWGVREPLAENPSTTWYRDGGELTVAVRLPDAAGTAPLSELDARLR